MILTSLAPPKARLPQLHGKFNCAYCGYVNGLLAYVAEIAGHTEQYWCPIKHALRLKTTHSRYQHFIDYGDAEGYRRRIEEVRRDFDDLRKQSNLAKHPDTRNE